MAQRKANKKAEEAMEIAAKYKEILDFGLLARAKMIDLQQLLPDHTELQETCDFINKMTLSQLTITVLSGTTKRMTLATSKQLMAQRNSAKHPLKPGVNSERRLTRNQR